MPEPQEPQFIDPDEALAPKPNAPPPAFGPSAFEPADLPQSKSIFEISDLAPWNLVPRTLESTYRDAKGIFTDDLGEPYFGEPKSYTGSFAQGALEFASYFVPAKWGISALTGTAKGAKFLGLGAKTAGYLEAVGAGAVADFAMSKDGAALSTFLSSLPNDTAKSIGSILATDADDTEVERRLKGVLEGALAGPLLEGTIRFLRGTYHLMRGGKEGSERAVAEGVEALKPLSDTADRIAAEEVAKIAPPEPIKVTELPENLKPAPVVEEAAQAGARPTIEPPPAFKGVFTKDMARAVWDDIEHMRADPTVREVFDRAVELKKPEAEVAAELGLDRLSDYLAKGGNTRDFRTGFDAKAVTHSLGEMVDHVYKAGKESISEQDALNFGMFAEVSGSPNPLADTAAFKAAAERAAGKPQALREISRWAAFGRLVWSFVEGNSKSIIKLAAQAIEDGTEASMAKAIDGLTFHTRMVALANGIKGEFGRGLGSFAHWRKFTFLKADQRRALEKGLRKGEEIPSLLESFSKAADDEPNLPLQDLLGDSERFAARINQLGGKTRLLKTLQAVSALSGVELPRGAAAEAVGKAAKAMRAPRLIDFVLEPFINSLVSGTRTISNVIQQQFIQGVYWQPLRRAMGAKIAQFATRNPERALAYAAEARIAMRQLRLTFDAATMQGTWNLVKNAFKTGEGTALRRESSEIAQTFRAEGALSYDGLSAFFKKNGISEDSAAARAAYWLFTKKGANLGPIIRAPGRVLSAEDELTKQFVLKPYIKSALTEEGLRRNPLNPDAAARYVDEEFQRVIGTGKLRTREALEAEALQEAKDLQHLMGLSDADMRTQMKANLDKKLADEAFTQKIANFGKDQANEAAATMEPRGASASLYRLANDLVWPRFFMPFIKASYSNISAGLRPLWLPGWWEWIQKSGLPANAPELKKIRSQLASDLLSKEPARIADTVGRTATAGILAGSIMYLASQRDEAGLPLITGSGPKSKEAKDVLKAAGWMPFSIKIPGLGYVSYQRADPIGMLIGSFADLFDYGRYASDEEQPELERIGAAATLAVQHKLQDTSYIKGLIDIIDVVKGEKSFWDWSRDTLATATVPNFITQVGRSASSAIRGEDPVVREVRGMADALGNRMPGAEEGLPVARDILGDPIPRDTFLGPDVISPWRISPAGEDPVRTELAAVGSSLGPPSKRRHKIDLEKVVDSKGRRAYDRFQEIIGTMAPGGMTLKDQLRAVIKAPGYQALPIRGMGNVESPRRRLLEGVIERHRGAAYVKLLQEMPEMVQAEIQQAESEGAIYAGLRNE